MDDEPCRAFFADPSCPAQRQYEALRAVFVDGLSQKEAAERFRYSYDAFRHLVGEFRAGVAAGGPPPFPRAKARTPSRSPSRPTPAS